jgi:hypothetical protein
LERLVRLGHGALVRQDDNTEVAEDRPNVHQPSQTAAGTGRSTHQRDDLAPEGHQGWLARRRSGHPVNAILQDRRDGTVVLRAGDQQAVMVEEELFESLAVLRHPLLGFEILVEQRQREVLQVDERDLGPGISATLGGDGHELLI